MAERIPVASPSLAFLVEDVTLSQAVKPWSRLICRLAKKLNKHERTQCIAVGHDSSRVLALGMMKEASPRLPGQGSNTLRTAAFRLPMPAACSCPLLEDTHMVWSTMIAAPAIWFYNRAMARALGRVDAA